MAKREQRFLVSRKKNFTIFQYNSFAKRSESGQQSFVSYISCLGYVSVIQEAEFLEKKQENSFLHKYVAVESL